MHSQIHLQKGSSGDRWISFAVCFQILLVGMKNMLIQAFEEMYEANAVWNTVLFVAVGVAYVLAYVSLGTRMISFPPITLWLVAFVGVSFAWSALLSPLGIPEYGELVGYFLSVCFLTAFMLTKLTTLEWIAYYMERFSYVIIVGSLICVITILNIGHTTTSEWSTYSMSLSNVIMVGVIWLLYRYFEKRKITALIGSALGIICILLCGSRNALLAIVAYVVAKTVIKLVSKSTPNGERWLYTVWSAALLLFFLFFDTAISLAARLLSFLGIYSRSIGLLGSDLFYDSGRSLIHSDLINALNERPLLGLGIGGDMAAIDWPAHNFYLSVLSTYGYLLGAILLVIFGAILWLAFRKSNAKTREILFIYVCLLIPRSFTGNDIWRSDIPWWTLALCLVAISNPTKEEPSALPPDLVDGAEEGSESGAPLASPSLN